MSGFLLLGATPEPTIQTVADFVNAQGTNTNFLTHPDGADVRFSGNMYFAAHVNLDSYGYAGGGQRGIAGKYGGSGNREWLIDWRGGSSGDARWQFIASPDGTATTVLKADAWQSGVGYPTLNTWYFIEVWHRNGVGIAIRIDRGYTDTVAFTGGLYGAGNDPLHIGSSSQKGWDGQMAGVFLSDQVTISGAGVGTPDDAISEDLYNDGVPPLWGNLSLATKAAAKRSGGANGDLFWPLNEASGTRESASGNTPLAETGTVGSVAFTAA